MSERRGFKGLNAYLHDPKLCIEHMSGLGSASIRSPVVPSLSNPGSSDQSKNDSLPAAIGSFMILIVIVLIVAFVSKARHDPRPVNQPTSDNYYAKAFAESLPVGNSSEKTTAEELTKNQPALKPGYQEKKPDIYNLGRVYSYDEIRYCVAEKIRIGAANGVVDLYNNVEIGIYNRYINDYNARCSSFKYYRSQLSNAQAEAEAIRPQLEREGRSRIKAEFSQPVQPSQAAQLAQAGNVPAGRKQLPPAGGVETYRVEFSVKEACWVQVISPSGKNLLAKEMTPSNAAPINVPKGARFTIGNAAAMRLVIDGKPRDVSAMTRNGVARFTLE